MIIVHWRCIRLGSLSSGSFMLHGYKSFCRAITHPFPSFSLWCTSTRTPYYPFPLCNFQILTSHLPRPFFFNVTGDKFGFLFLSMWRASLAKVGNTLDDQPYPTIIDDRARKQLFDSGYVRREAVSSPKQNGDINRTLLMLTLSLAYQGFVCTMIIIKIIIIKGSVL